MKTLNFLLASLFLVFLLSSTSAVSVSYGEWAGSNSITDGQDAYFNYYFAGFESGMSLSIKLYDASNNLVYTFLDTSTSGASYYNSVPVQISESIYKNPGNYELTFYSTDSDNAPSAMTIYLTVSSSTTTNNAPAITSTPIVTVIEENSYSYQVTASDPEGNSLTYSLSSAPSWLSINSGLISGTAPSVSSNTANTVVVSVSDGTNVISQTYTLTILDSASIPDTTSPVITLIGSSTLTIQLGSIYTDAGATATDDRDGNLTSQINTSSNVNTSVLGTYQVNYTVSDLAGNTATATRTVNVVDTLSVEITSPTNKTYYYSKSKKTMDFKFEIGENATACWYQLNNESNISFSCSLTKLEDINVKTGQNTLIIYANDSEGNISSDSVTFRYTKKSSSSSGGSGITTIISPITDVEPTGNVVIPGIQTENKEDYTMLYAFIIATTSLGIIILSIILSRKLKEIKKDKKVSNQLDKIQEQPFY